MNVDDISSRHQLTEQVPQYRNKTFNYGNLISLISQIIYSKSRQLQISEQWIAQPNKTLSSHTFLIS